MARQVLVLVAVVVAAILVAGLVLAVMDARGRVRAEALDRAVTVATTVADIPEIRAAVVGPEPSGVVQPLAEQIRVDTGVDFVVVMGLDRTRYSHPDPALIGRTFIGDVGQAPAGEVFTQDYTGTLGPSVRVVVPIRDVDGAVVALVAVGVVLDRVDAAFWRTVVPIGIVGAAALALALGSAWLIARRVRRQTYGLDGRELARMYEYHNAVLHAVREGLLLVDAERRVELVNAEARRLLRLDADAVGGPLAGLGLPDDLVRAAGGDAPGADAVVEVGGRALVVNAAPARAGAPCRRRRHAAGPHRVAGRHGRAGRRPPAVGGVAFAEPRVGEPAAHRDPARRDGSHGRGARLRSRGTADRGAAGRPDGGVHG